MVIQNIKIITDHPVAIDSLDHQIPHGTKNDNTGPDAFIEEVEASIEPGKKLTYADLGCAGGLMPIKFFERGHRAIGIEGSDYNLRRSDDSPHRNQWMKYYGNVLFTCDISRRFAVIDEEKRSYVGFDLITAWEVMEHIPPEREDMVYMNVYNMLNDEGIFVGTVSLVEEHSSGTNLHVNVKGMAEWHTNMSKWFEIFEYPFKEKVRYDGNNFHFCLKKRKS